MEVGEQGGMISDLYPDCRPDRRQSDCRAEMKPSPVPDGLPPSVSGPPDWPDAKAPIAVVRQCHEGWVGDHDGLTAGDLAAALLRA